jgi:hypothetical protein
MYTSVDARQEICHFHVNEHYISTGCDLQFVYSVTPAMMQINGRDNGEQRRPSP